MNKSKKKLLEMISRINTASLSKCLKVINNLVTKGLIDDYAIGGGYALIYYSIPMLTYDLDICCLFNRERLIVDMGDIYAELQKMGYKPEEEYVMIAGFPVQFISAESNSLMEEAITESVEIKYGGVTTNIIKLEYLIAVMSQLGRPKDKYKLSELMKSDVKFDKDFLYAILKRYNLVKKWEKIRDAE